MRYNIKGWWQHGRESLQWCIICTVPSPYDISPLPWKRILVLGACEIDLILVLMKNFARK